MRKSKFNEEQIAMALCRGEAGTPVADLEGMSGSISNGLSNIYWVDARVLDEPRPGPAGRLPETTGPGASPTP